jgi:thymidylate synthase (FAD)
MKFAEPRVHLVGYTCIDYAGLENYLQSVGCTEFLEFVRAAKGAGISDGEILCSTYAKLCYAALTVGRNRNISRTREIKDNLLNCWDSGHGSVFEHAQLNFIATDVSRVFTHELVRHRVGTAFSQTSGRYVRTDTLEFVSDPLLYPAHARIEALLNHIEAEYKAISADLGVDACEDFAKRKKLTSALRRILPNGQANEIGFSINLRALRHVVQMRTAAGAEREIRWVFAEVYVLCNARFPTLFADAKVREVDGIVEVSGLKTQPYQA